ncbi:MAG: DUF2244 domain-containing protein [Alphaproteobacteria bacterium]|jgi:uncharacterized membrane protein|nr:DUF2244 domain-containing protein [Alphaproteobacteria bacterium]MBT5799184.1 DUF2244 domain-containing protein [Alphaproteobacteria bacterium]MDC3311050.1 DUF2244 domain-containing protein [Alphaproteobacteria bacterium]
MKVKHMVDPSKKSFWHHTKQDMEQEVITITLWPYRSLGRRGYLYLMTGFIGLIFILSLLFYTLGAWPVIGFLGIEVGLVWLIFRVNYNSGRNYEQIFITADKTSIEKVSWRGKTHRFDISSAWIAAKCIKANGQSDKLLLTYHSKQLEIGKFLPPREKFSLAIALNDSFERMRGAT